LSRAKCHVGIPFSLFEYPPFFDSGSNRNPFVAGFDHFLQIVIGHDLARQF